MASPAGPNSTPPPSSGDRLDSWKEIAAYLKRDERTVRRWEKSEGLPVHRHVHNRQASVFAYRAELDTWWNDGRTRLQAEPASELAAAPAEWRKRPMLFLGGLAVVLLAGLAAWQWLRPAPARAAKVALAVLPFENLTGDAEREYLVSGFTEEVITQLARIDPARLDVIARTTIQRYKGSPKTVAEIGRELGVDYVLEGSIRLSEGRLRVTSQLIEVRGQTHLWAQSYDSESPNLIAVQDQVSQEVAHYVKVAVAKPSAPDAERAHSANPDAYEAYLRARYHQSLGSVRDTDLAIAYFRKAIEIDPNFAAAHAGIARSYVFGVRIRPRDAMQQARASAQRALELAPDLTDAQIAAALVKLYGDWDQAAAEQALRRAVEQDPGNPETHFHYAQCLAVAGRFDEAITAARRAQRLDPFSPLIGHYIGRLFYFQQQYARAEQEFQRTIEVNPGYTWTHLFRALNFEQVGDFDAALAARQKYWALMGVKPEEVARLGEVYKASGYAGVRREWARWIEGFVQVSGYVTSTELALLNVELKQPDEALKWLERAFNDHTRDLIFLRVQPQLIEFGRDPRFAKLLSRFKFPAVAQT